VTVLRFRPRADQELDDIWAFIAEDNPTAASRFVRLIEERCRLLAENPLMGRSRTELAPNLRSFPVGDYIIFYVPIENGVEIVRVVSGSRDIEALF
jgi:toxin ParE1/3/4